MGAFIFGADILKHSGNPVWTSELDKQFRNWMETLMVPLWERQIDISHGNWSTNARRTALAYASFTGNRYQFNRLVALHKIHLTDPLGSAPWGEINETTRNWAPSGRVDQAHLRMTKPGRRGI